MMRDLNVNIHRTFTSAVTIAVAALAVAGCGGAPRRPAVGEAGPRPGSIVVWGAGTDLAFPIYEEVGSQLRGRGITLNYQLNTIDAAMSNLRAGRIAFLASESAQPPSLPRRDTTSATYLPVGFTAVSVIYNLPGLKAPLKLDGNAIADIYRGAIKRWNDRGIARENRGVKLPSTLITVVHRSDAATATDLFTQYVAAGSRAWRRSVGAGTSVSWPGGTAVSDEQNMQQLIGRTEGTIGYLDRATAVQAKLQSARLRNPSGSYVAPSMRATTAVGDQHPGPDGGLSFPTINASVSAAYPIASEEYVLVYRDPCDAGMSPRDATATQQLLSYLLGSGQSIVRRFQFAPLSGGLQRRALAEVHRMTCGSQPIG
jgi:phosphate transport system substrate-binding protein